MPRLAAIGLLCACLYAMLLGGAWAGSRGIPAMAAQATALDPLGDTDGPQSTWPDDSSELVEEPDASGGQPVSDLAGDLAPSFPGDSSALVEEPDASGGQPDSSDPEGEPASEPPDAAAPPAAPGRPGPQDGGARPPGRDAEPKPKAKPNPKSGAKPSPRPKPRRGDDHNHGSSSKPASEKATPLRRPDGRPTIENPTFSDAGLGAAPIGVPNFFIEKFRIPPFLLPIYQAAGVEYGVRWEILAAINEIETDYGRNLNVSSAGALGWMQFMPATWKAYGVDANGDGRKDPYNPVDAIFAAARYLKASGAEQDLRGALFAYNRADWYVDSVMMRARLLAGLPADLVDSLTGLTQARFPVHARSTYADELKSRGRRAQAGANAAFAVESQGTRQGIRVFAKRGAPVIAVNDGRIVGMGESARLGRYIKLQDAHGNTFTYAHLGRLSETYPVLKKRQVTRAAISRELKLPKSDPKPGSAASTTRRAAARGDERRAYGRTAPKRPAPPAAREAADKQRLFAHPTRPNAKAAGGGAQVTRAGADRRRKTQRTEPIVGGMKFDFDDYEFRELRKGARVIGGTVLGRLGGDRAGQAPHVLFEIRPAGRGAPRIDPKPILDGWKLLESTAIYRASRKNPFFGRDAEQPSIGQILLMSKEALMRRVVRNPRIEIYGCGERDILSGQIDRRVLASLEFLAASGLRPTVTSLKCGHGYYTASGNVSHHSSGNAVDIAAVNGIPMTGHQGRGSITELTIQRLLTLQGAMKPDQIISLMTFEGADNTYAMADHHDHIHVGWRPQYNGDTAAVRRFNAILRPQQWTKLVERLGEIDNPRVREQPSRYAVKVVRRPSRAAHSE